MDNDDIEITLDNENENIDVNEENYVYINIPESVITEMQEDIAENTANIVLLESSSGNKITLSIDSNYVMSLQLLNKNNEVLSTGTIDLPIESMVVNATYNDGVLTLTLQNGTTLDVDISDIISGLQREITANNKLSSDLVDDTNKVHKFVTQAEKNKLAGIETGATKTVVDSALSASSTNPVQNKKVKEALDTKVDKVQGKGLSTNDYDNTEKAQVATNKADIAAIKQEQTIQNTNIQTNATNIEGLTEDLEAVEDTVAEHTQAIADLEAGQATQDSAIEALQTECERLRDDLANTTASVEGEGESVTLNNTANARFKKFATGGNSKQETTEGRNLLKTSLEIMKSLNIQGTWNNNIYTFHGLTFEVNEDLSIIVDGTSNADTNFYLARNNSNPFELSSGTYYLTSHEITGASNTWKTQFNIGGTNYNIYGNESNKEATVTLTEDTLNNGALLIIYSGQTLSKVKFCPMVATTSNAEYEKYTYGASPNPSYEQPIKSCGDDINLFDKDNANILNVYINNTSGSILEHAGARTLYLPIEGEKKYTVSKKASTRFIVGTTTAIPNIGSTCNLTIAHNNETSITIETTENDNYLCVFYYLSTADTLTEEEIRNSIKIQEGSIATPYSPYGMGSITEKIVNKNIIKLQGITSQGITSTLNTDGSFRISGTCASTWAHITQVINKNFEPGDYTFSISKTLNYAIYIQLRFEDGTYTNYSISVGSTTKAITTTKKAVKYEISISSLTAGNAIDDTIFLQLEEGSIATEIIPHAEQTYTIPTQQPMRSIGDVRDGFVKVNGKWYERHNIKKYIFDGTEHCQYSSATFVFDQITDIDYQNINNVPLSNYYLGVTPVFAAREITGNNVITISNIQYRIYIKDSRYTTPNDFKVMLKDLYDNNNAAYIFYIKEQPTDLPCTIEQEAILNQIEQEAKTYEGVTHIFSEDEVPAYVEAKAYKDTDSFLNSLEARIELLEN